MVLKFLEWLIRAYMNWKHPAAPKSAGSNRVGDGTHPCQLFIDALDESLINLDQLLLLIQEQTQALQQCENANNPQPLMGSQKQQARISKKQQTILWLVKVNRVVIGIVRNVT